MNRKIIFGRSLKDFLFAILPAVAVVAIALFFAIKFVNPAPPNHLVISTGEGEGDYQIYAKRYQEILKEDGIKLEIRASTGTAENLKQLQNENSDIDVGFVQDGLGSPEEDPDLVSLGSLYYEPIWVFYRGSAEINRLVQLEGKKIAVGKLNGGTRSLALHILEENGIDEKHAQLINIGWQDAADALRDGQVDAAIYLATPDDPLIESLINDRSLKLMSFDQAEAITRQIPYLHHLVLPHGAIDLQKNLPNRDVDLVSPTATLVARDSLHPALIYLLLKAIQVVHSAPGLLEKKGEFPTDKDFLFPLSEEAKIFYKSGTPFWQRYLPFWLATLIERFILIVIPIVALVLPMVKLVPRLYQWRIKTRIYKRYGELKFLETQIHPKISQTEYAHYITQLDGIEDRVNGMKVPLDFSEHIYSLKEHIEFVRARLRRVVGVST